MMLGTIMLRPPKGSWSMCRGTPTSPTCVWDTVGAERLDVHRETSITHLSPGSSALILSPLTLTIATNTNLHKKQKQADKVTAESTAIEPGYGVYDIDLITRSVPDKTVIPSDGPTMICA